MKDVKNSVLNGDEFEVLDHATPVFRVVPTATAKKAEYTFTDLSKLQFVKGSANMAKNVDTVVYGN